MCCKVLGHFETTLKLGFEKFILFIFQSEKTFFWNLDTSLELKKHVYDLFAR